ncbi:MAG: FAD-linked oxidoreductase [Symploca sp. SIO2C1]|nr:FAD-linked oxidoreductase [Symploca sp. SIO2C1]
MISEKNRVPAWQWVTKIFSKWIGTDEAGTSSKLEPLSPDWHNWSNNISYNSKGTSYYFMPTNKDELRDALRQVKRAKENNVEVTVRVSGQRHSQPPLVIHDNRDVGDEDPPVFLVDMSCYADDATGGERLKIDPEDPYRVIMNSGVREDELEAFLTNNGNDLMMKTVTAGGSFSLGGITAVDAHGATWQEGIFAETVYSFTIMNDPDAPELLEITADDTPLPNGWSPIQFARVSLGGLGIVTSIKLNVQQRALTGGTKCFEYSDEENEKDYFVNNINVLLMGKLGEEDGHDRLEVFFNPYKEMESQKGFLALFWDVDEDLASGTYKTEAEDVNVCEDADNGNGDYGSPIINIKAVQNIGWYAQFPKGKELRTAMMNLFMTAIEAVVGRTNENNLELWYIIPVPPVIFMSYFIPLGDIGPTGLGKAWDALKVVADKVRGSQQDFYIAGPMEFRFVKGGDTAMSGTYSANPDEYFVNLDLLGFMKADRNEKNNVVDRDDQQRYEALLEFFAAVEQEWVAMGGFPHHGKMYGFYNPHNLGDKSIRPFNPGFLADLRERRGERLTKFKEFCDSMDPDKIFRNKYLTMLLGE